MIHVDIYYRNVLSHVDNKSLVFDETIYPFHTLNSLTALCQFSEQVQFYCAAKLDVGSLLFFYLTVKYAPHHSH